MHNLDSFAGYQIYVTGLPGKSRDEQLIIELDKLGLRAKREFGVVPNRADERTRYFEDGALGRRPLMGHLGCRLAHLKAAKDFLTTRAKFLLVFEDDAKLSKHFDIESIQGFMDTCTRPTVVLLGQKDGTPDFVITRTSPRNFARIFYGPPYSFAYAMNRSAAELISKGAEKHGPRGFSDWPPELAGNAKFYHSKLDMVSLRSIPSTISAESATEKVNLGNRVASLALGIFVDRSIPLKFIFWDTFLRNLALVVYRSSKKGRV